MTTVAIPPAQVKDALTTTGQDWLLRYWGADADKHLEKTASVLGKFVRAYRRRFKEVPDLFGLVEANPTKAAAFFQPDTLLASQEMKIMVWRILLGCEIQGIDLRYRAGQTTSLQIRLVSPYGEEESYTTEHPSDFRVLRHLGLTGTGDDFVLQGYYALAGTR